MMATFLSSNPIVFNPCYFGRHYGTRAARTRNLEVPGLVLRTIPERRRVVRRHRPAALDPGDAPRLRLGFERNHVAVLPHLHGDGVAGIDGRGEARGVLLEGGGGV